MNPNPQLELDLYQTDDATSDFREWLLSLPPTPWATSGDLEPVGQIIPRILRDAYEAGQSHESG